MNLLLWKLIVKELLNLHKTEDIFDNFEEFANKLENDKFWLNILKVFKNKEKVKKYFDIHKEGNGFKDYEYINIDKNTTLKFVRSYKNIEENKLFNDKNNWYYKEPLDKKIIKKTI